MGSFTVNVIFDLLQERKALVNPAKGGNRFDRRERVEAVFPERICAKIASRSASYYSWFLNMDRQGGPIRDYLRRLFEEDPYEVIREMVEKCERLLGQHVLRAAFSPDVWEELFALLGRENLLFARGSEGARRLERTSEAAPQRALAWLFLAAGMDGFTFEQYERLLSCWRLMNCVFIPDGAQEPLRRMKAAELLYLDGSRREAISQLGLAAGKLRETLKEEESGQNATNSPDGAAGASAAGSRDAAGARGTSRIRENRELLGKILLRLGEMHGQNDGDKGEDEKACECFRESVQCGCLEAVTPLAVQELKNGRNEAAREALERGAEADIPACLRMLGNSFYTGDALAGIRKDLRRAAVYYFRGANPDDKASGDAVCQYMFGKILEESPGSGRSAMEGWENKKGVSGNATKGAYGAFADPEYWYDAAARQGNTEAAARLNHLRWYAFGAGQSFPYETESERDGEGALPVSARVEDAAVSGGTYANKQKEKGSFQMDRGKSFCLLNSFSEKNRQFAQTLPDGKYTVLVYGEQTEGLLQESVSRPECRAGTMAQGFFRIGSGFLEQAGSHSPASSQWLMDSFPEILCVAFDETEQKNIEDGLQILRTAFLLHEKAGSFGRKGDEDLFYLLSSRVKLYVLGQEEYMAPVFDSVCSRMGDFYLPLFLCDRAKMTSAWILDRLPLFIPCLQESGSRADDDGRPQPGRHMPSSGFQYVCLGAGRSGETERWKGAAGKKDLGDECDLPHPEAARYAGLHEKNLRRRGEKERTCRMDVAVFGDHPGIVQLCKDMIASAQIEDSESFPFSLTVIGENADLLEEKLLSDCPGIADPPEGLVVEAPLFVKMRAQSREFQELLRVSPVKERTPEKEALANRIQSAGCIFVYSKEENRNLTLSMYLREWYLKTDPAFARLPLIAAYCEKKERAEQMRTLTAGAEKAGFGWFNNYRIEAFGTMEQLFSYDAVARNRIERRALQLHFTYYTFTVRADRFRAEHDYFSRSYNRDSSMMNALALPYRLFSAGAAFADWRDYAQDISWDVLAEQFESWLEARDLQEGDGQGEARDRLERLAAYEHGRWNRYMLSRGWMPASMAQMLAYIQRGNGRHQLYIAKLHPFLCCWKDLGEAGEAPSGIQKEYSSIMRQLRPDRTPADIRGIDRENVRKTAAILRDADLQGENGWREK